MAEYILMPKLGFDMREGVLVTWHKGEGDGIEKGEVVAEIESDKATLELESQSTGTILKFLAEAGDVVPIGGRLAIVGESGEDISSMEAALAEVVTETATAVKHEPASHTPVVAAPAVVSTEFPDGVKASPVARRIAREHGINLANVGGSGPGNRIRKTDVEAFISNVTITPSVTIEPTPIPPGPETSEVPASRLRQAIGRRMTESKTSVPHFYVTSDVDMAPALALRKQINPLLPDERKVTVNDMIVKAAALALQDFPNLNASYAGDKIVHHNRINVGTAVAIEGGLLTVVQQNTNKAPLSQIAADNKSMINRARERKNRPTDFEGGTFTVSNLGAFEVDHFIAIINPPDAAILAVGTAAQVPVVIDGELAIGWRMKATVSADHRVTDGAEAAQFMQTFKAILQEPLRLLV